MKISFSLCVLAILGAALLPGCRAKNLLPGAPNIDPIAAPATPAPMPASPFQITARAAKTRFVVGEPVALEIEIKNVSTAAVDLNFTSGQKFDFSATRVGEADAIWSYGMNKRFIQALSRTTLEAGKSLRFETVWTGAGAGKYTVRALVKANGGLDATDFEVEVSE